MTAEFPDPAGSTLGRPGLTTLVVFGLLCLLLAPERTHARQVYGLNLPLHLNQAYLGDLYAEVDMRGRAAVDAEHLFDLLEPHLQSALLANIRQHIQGETEMVPLAELDSEALGLRFDASQLSIEAEVQLEQLRTRQETLSGSREQSPAAFERPESFALGMDLGYSREYVHRAATQDTGMRKPDVGLDGAMNLFGFNGINAVGSATYRGEDEDPWRRGPAQVFHDHYDSATRFSAGDIRPPVRSFQQSPGLAGISISRLYGEIRPLRNIRASGRRELILERPSQVDVEINGVVVQSRLLAPGRYELSDFPFAGGANRIRLLVEDETGRREVADFSLFYYPELLGQGVTRFSANAGRIERLESADIRYLDEKGFTGFVEHGISDQITLAGSLQHRDDGFSALGVGVNTGTPLGLFGLDISGSGLRDNRNTHQMAGSLAWAWNAPRDAMVPLTLYLDAEYREPQYRTMASPLEPDNVRLRSLGRMQIRLPGDWGAGLSTQYRQGRQPATEDLRTDLSFSRSLPGRGNLFFNISREKRERSEYAAFFGFSLRLGERGMLRKRFDTDNHRLRMDAIRLARRDIHDVSGRATVTRARDNASAGTRIAWHGNRMDAEFETTARGTRDFDQTPEHRSRMLLRTGFGITPSGGGPGRDMTSGFALFRPHATLEDRPVYIREGGAVGMAARTDLFGAATVPMRRGYLPRTLNIEVEELPPGYDIGATQRQLLPGAFSAWVFDVGSDASRTLLGTLLDRDGEPVERMTGRLVTEDGDTVARLFTNLAGRFVAERVAPGRYRIEMGTKGSTEWILVDEDSEGMVNVGDITIE